MNLKMVGIDGKVIAERPAVVKAKKKPVAEENLFDASKVDPDIMNMLCDKLISACDLIGENPRTGETKVFSEPEEARAWEKQMERQGFNLVNA